MLLKMEYSGASCLFLALLCLLLPLDWILAALFAAMIHELCHIISVVLMGGSIYSLRFNIWGAVMESSQFEPWQEFLCVLAGPAGSLSLLLLSNLFPKTALCGLVQGLFNLIPVYPLDGGRAMWCLTSIFFSQLFAENICRWVAWISFIVIFALGIYGTFVLKLGVFPVIAALLILVRVHQGKIPCKEGKLGVQ